MTEETQNLAEVPEVQAQEPAPEQAETAAPAPDAEVPEVKADAPQKTFTQEELDAIIAKRLSKEQRKWEREQKLRAAKPAAEPPAELPPADQFESTEAYAEALAERKAEELLARREAERQQAELLEAYADREEQAMEKYEDFKQVVYNPNLPVTQVMAQTIQASEIGPEIAYYLGTNPKDAERISKMSPFMQAKEIGKIEAKLADNPPTKKPSSAPAPIAPVTPRGGNGKSLDTTDPRSIKEMSTSEWIEAERQRQIKKWEAQRLR